MKKQELAKDLIKSEGKCMHMFASCFWCPMDKSDDPDSPKVYRYCSKNRSERLEWAKNYIKEQAK